MQDRDKFYRRNPGLLWEDYQTSSGDAFGSSFGLNYDSYGVTQLGLNEAILYSRDNQDNFLSPQKANELGADYGLEFDKPVSQDEFDFRKERKRKELARQSVLARAESGIGTGAASLTGGFMGALADPLNIAAAFVPVVGEARMAQMAARLGSVNRARVAAGAIEGSVGAAIMEAPTLALTARAQADYDMYDSMMNIAFGTVIGGGLHVTGGYIKDRFSGRVTGNAVPDRISQVDINTKQQAFRTAFADAIEGRQIDVEDILLSDPKYLKPVKQIVADELDARITPLSTDNLSKLERRFNNALLYEDGRFSSRQQADSYVRNQAKQDGVNRTDFIIENDGESVRVLKAKEAELVRAENGEVLKFKSFDDAKKYADEQNNSYRNANADTDARAWSNIQEYHPVNLKPKAGQSAQEFVVVKGLDAEGAAKFREKPAGIYRARNLDIKAERFDPMNISHVRKFAEKKEAPSALTQEFRARYPEADTLTARGQELTPEQALKDAEDIVDSLAPIMNGMDKKLRKELDALLKAADNEIKEGEEMSEAIQAFGACMMRG